MRIASVHLQVSNLQRSKEFYSDLLGFVPAFEENQTVELRSKDDGPAVVVLSERKGARPKPPGTTGLYHAAVLLPSRKELAKMFRRLYEHRWPLHGAVDHGVSEALYLADPDGNGIELYSDRARELWPKKNDELQLVTEELDLGNLLSELSNDSTGWNGIHPKTAIGHIHLQVSDLSRAETFYHTLLGFDVVQRSFPGALFVSSDGYHHHVGLNVWAGKGAPPPPTDAVGLRSFTILVDDTAVIKGVEQRLTSHGISFTKDRTQDREKILTRDFDGIRLELVTKENR